MPTIIRNPAKGGGLSTLQWLQKYYPEVYDKVVNLPEHRSSLSPGRRDYRDGIWAAKHPSRSGRFP